MPILNTVDKYVEVRGLDEKYKQIIHDYFFEVAKESLQAQSAIPIAGSSMAIAVFKSTLRDDKLIVVPLFHPPYARTHKGTPIYRMLLYLFHFKVSDELSEKITAWAVENGCFYNALPLADTLVNLPDRWNMSLKRYSHFAYSPLERRYVLQLYRSTKGFTKYFNHFRRRKSIG